MARHIPYKENHREVNGLLEKKCTIHDIYSPDDKSPWFPCTDEFYYKTEMNKTDGLQTWCKKCSIKKAYQIALDNPERRKLYAKKEDAKPKSKLRRRKRTQKIRDNGVYDEYRNNNPEKFKKYQENHRIHDITESEWRNCLKVFGNECAYCGLPIEKHIVQKKGKYIIMNFHKDHITHDGYNDLRNAIPACRECNSYKWKSNMEEWYKEQSFFAEEKLQFIYWWANEGYKDYIEDKLPYRIVRERNEGTSTYHFNLWSVDEKRNLIDILATKNKKKELKNDIQNLFK